MVLTWRPHKRRASQSVFCFIRLDRSFSEKASHKSFFFFPFNSVFGSLLLTFLWVSCYPWKYTASSKLLKLLLAVVLYINPYISLNLFQVACDSLADTVFNTVWTLGCRPFMNSQRAACICAEEEKEELWGRGDSFPILSDATQSCRSGRC